MAEADRERWNERYRSRGEAVPGVAAFFAEIEDLLPTSGRALDVAGGRGRHAIWLAQRGLDVTVTDISDVGLGIAERAAARAKVRVHTRLCDLEEEPLPPGPWDLIVTVDYLQRSLFAVYPRLLAPGGLLVMEHPTRTNQTRNPRPSARHVLEDGEMRTLVQGLEIVRYEERWREGRYAAGLLGRKVT